jgi:hypothetical protein
MDTSKTALGMLSSEAIMVGRRHNLLVVNDIMDLTTICPPSAIVLYISAKEEI